MATKKKKKADKEVLSNVQDEIIERGREIWLAGLGAFATVEEEGSKLYQSLVDRGRKMEKKGQKQLTAVVDDINAKQEEVVGRVGGTIDKIEGSISDAVESAMHQLDLPSRAEVKDLTDKVNILSEKVDLLADIMEKQKAKKA